MTQSALFVAVSLFAATLAQASVGKIVVDCSTPLATDGGASLQVTRVIGETGLAYFATAGQGNLLRNLESGAVKVEVAKSIESAGSSYSNHDEQFFLVLSKETHGTGPVQTDWVLSGDFLDRSTGRVAHVNSGVRCTFTQ